MKKFFAKKLTASQKPIMIALLAVASVLTILVAIDLFGKPNNIDTKNSNQVIDEQELSGEQLEYEEVATMTQVEKDKFREDVPVNIVVPDINTELNEAEKLEIALPTVVVEAAPGSDSSFRDFNISAENDVFSPRKIIANVGDTVHVDFTAVDKDYDIVFPSYGMMQTAKQGQTKMLEFQALQEGSFTYYCSACGGPESGPVGSFIIVQP